MGFLRSLVTAIHEAVVMTGRRATVRLVRGRGAVRRARTEAVGQLLQSLGAVAASLLVAAPAVGLVARLGTDVGLWDWLEVPPPHLDPLFSLRNLVLGTVLLMVFTWLVRARERVVVEEFVDYTTGEGQAVAGLGTLLVSELSRLRELYSGVNERLSVPMSVGVPRRGGAGPGADAGSFLSVRVDDVTEVLSGAVASETRIKGWGIEMPIGLILALVGRVARGPRVIGSVHFTKSGGGPTVTAQVVGRGRSHQWRVDGSGLTPGEPVDRAFLEPMVAEIACRMFNDLTLRGSVRWGAIRRFTEYLELYWDSLRTPRHRAGHLKRAEGKLLQAIAEDETFDLAYYNLGVIYSQLAQTEQAAAHASAYVERCSDPKHTYHARTDAAIGAFQRAIELNRDRSEAIYALAVHQFAKVQRHKRPSPHHEYDLECVVCHCERVLELDSGNAQAHDLKGLAQLQLSDLAGAISSHRHAVRASWRQLRRAELTHQTAPAALDSPLPAARANASAALHNLALAYGERAREGPIGRRSWLRRWHADRVFGAAEWLAPGHSRAGTLFARGANREAWDRPRLAAQSYGRAVRLDSEHPLHWARFARAQAKCGLPDAAEQCADVALISLARWYRRTLEPHAPKETNATRDDTLQTLAEAYTALRRPADTDRMTAYRELAEPLAAAEQARRVDQLEELANRYGRGSFEREQVLIVLARTLGAQAHWAQAAACYEALIAELRDEREVSIRRHDLHAKFARALRRAGDHHGALREAARALLLDPLSPVTRREVGKAHFALRQYDEAIEAWQHTLWLTPNDPHLHWRVAFCHWSAAQDRPVTDRPWQSLEDAATGFERAALLFGVDMIEGWAWSHLWAGRVHQELGDPGEAIRHLRNARGCKQTEMAASLLLGEAYQTLGESTLSRERLKTALDLARGPSAAEADEVDWGHALSVAEITARAEVALTRSAIADGDSDEARSLALAACHDASRVDALKPRERLSREAAELLEATGSHGVNGNGARPAPRASRLRIASWVYPGAFGA